MASEFGRKFYDLLRIHYEQGTKIEYLAMDERHKQYVRIIDDLYEHWRHNPAMNLIDFIREKYGITQYATIYKLTRAINFMAAMGQSGQRDMMRFKANAYADRMFKIGDATGDWKPIDKAIAHVTKINQLDQPDPAESIEDQIPKMGYMLTTRAKDVKEGAQEHTPAQIEAMFRHYGAKRDAWQSMMDGGESTADRYDEQGNYIRRARPLAASQTSEAEEAELMELDAEFEREYSKEQDEGYDREE